MSRSSTRARSTDPSTGLATVMGAIYEHFPVDVSRETSRPKAGSRRGASGRPFDDIRPVAFRERCAGRSETRTVTTEQDLWVLHPSDPETPTRGAARLLLIERADPGRSSSTCAARCARRCRVSRETSRSYTLVVACRPAPCDPEGAVASGLGEWAARRIRPLHATWCPKGPCHGTASHHRRILRTTLGPPRRGAITASHSSDGALQWGAAWRCSAPLGRGGVFHVKHRKPWPG